MIKVLPTFFLFFLFFIWGSDYPATRHSSSRFLWRDALLHAKLLGKAHPVPGLIPEGVVCVVDI